MAMTEAQIQAKIDALNEKKKELKKKERAKKKAELAKAKAEEEKKIAKTNAVIADLTRLWGNCDNDEELIAQFSRSIIKNNPALKEKVEEIIK